MRALADGIYTIGAIAVDSLGTRGRPRTLQVKLARTTATPPQNASGGYNYVYVAGVKTLVVELDWDASPEGSVTGYEVRNGSTVECSASLATDCIDFSPASSGSTTYAIRTTTRTARASRSSCPTDYTVSPSAPLVPTLYSLTTGTSNSTLQCGLAQAPPCESSATFVGGADATDTAPLLLGCLSSLPSGVTLGAWYRHLRRLVHEHRQPGMRAAEDRCWCPRT